MTTAANPLFTRRRPGLACFAAALLALALALASSLAAAQPPATAAWRDVERVVAFADVHGAYAELTPLLRETGIVDQDLHWSAGRTHVVSLGDLLDRGADSRKVMDLLMRLQQEAAAAGGQVHVVLGNHEAMNVLGDLRYVAPGEYAAFAADETPEIRERARQEWLRAQGPGAAAQFDERFPAGYFAHRAALGPTGAYGRWLLAQPVMISINDTLFMHAGPSSQLKGMSVDEVNLRYRTALVEYLAALEALERAQLLQPGDSYSERPGLARQRLAAAAAPGAVPQTADLSAAVERLVAADANPLLDMDGPNWYRGAALCNEAAEADVLYPLLQQFGVARVVLGHTPTRDRRAAARFDGRVIKLDAGMNRAAYQGRAAALILEKNARTVRYPGEPAPMPIAEEQFHVAPSELDDAVVASILQDGTVTVTGPAAPGQLQVTVERDGRKVHAMFFATSENASRRELAAYRLDRLLELGIVPATVAREVQGQRGVLQARPVKTVTQADVQRQSLRSDGWCALEPQFQLVYAFDALVGNAGRTPETLLFDADEWFVYVTGHDKAFGTGRAFPAYLETQPPKPGTELRRRMQALNEASLATALAGAVDARAIKALLARRDALLALPMPAAVAH